MTISLASVTHSRRELPPRVLLMGVEKIGKSTFAAESPSPIFLPIKGEEGIDALDVPTFPTAQTYSDVMEAIVALCSEEHQFKTVVIDSVTSLEPLVWDAVCQADGAVSIEKVGGGFGKGYTEAIKFWRNLLDGIDYLRQAKGMGCVLIGHVTAKLFTDPLADPYDKYLLSINKAADGLLSRWCDAILFASRKSIVKRAEIKGGKEATRAIGDGQPKLYTQQRPAHPGGGRGVYGQLPYELPLSWPAWQEAIATVTKAQADQVASK